MFVLHTLIVLWIENLTTIRMDYCASTFQKVVEAGRRYDCYKKVNTRPKNTLGITCQINAGWNWCFKLNCDENLGFNRVVNQIYKILRK
jgi:hypothetical protein